MALIGGRISSLVDPLGGSEMDLQTLRPAWNSHSFKPETKPHFWFIFEAFRSKKTDGKVWPKFLRLQPLFLDFFSMLDASVLEYC